MTRREIIALAASALKPPSPAPSILVHEHILVDFIGADEIRPGRYDRAEVFRTALPFLKELVSFGCKRLLDCTPNFLGRDPELLARLGQASGIEIWSNTGLYSAVNHKYLPSFVRQETPEQIAKRWIAESREPWKPRFIKIGVNKGPLDELDRKVVLAASLASRETGLTIASHTGDGAAALEQLQLIANPSKFVWVHAQNEKNFRIHEQVARAGAWVELDGIRAESADAHLACLRHLAEHRLLGQVLLSQDSGWYHVGEPGGGKYRGYTYLYTDFLPRLNPDWITQLMWTNPRAAFGA